MRWVGMVIVSLYPRTYSELVKFNEFDLEGRVFYNRDWKTK